MITFKEWLKMREAMTSTSCVANYSRPSFPIIRRETPRKKKKDDAK